MTPTQRTEDLAADVSEGEKKARFWKKPVRSGVTVLENGRLDIDLSEWGFPGWLAEVENYLLPHVVSGQSGQLSPNTVPSVGDTLPPGLNIVIHVVGSRGDIQPFLALGQSLKDCGHRVRLATHLAFQHLVEDTGLEFFSIGGDPAELMTYMVRNAGLLPQFKTIRTGAVRRHQRDMKNIINGCWRSCVTAGDGTSLDSTPSDHTGIESRQRPFVADAIIANPPSMAHIHCAERLGIPLTIIFTMPWSPTQAFPHPLVNIRRHSTKPTVANFVSYNFVDMLLWQGLGDIINTLRRKCLHLDILDASQALGLLHRLHIPHTYIWSPALLAKPLDWYEEIDICGFVSSPAEIDYQPPDDLFDFLQRGPPPIYVGFGSIVVDNPRQLSEIVIDAISRTGQRAIISKGWTGLDTGGLEVPEQIFLLGDCPHDWLFQHVSCVVHHGGAGTTHAGLSHGCPTIIIPFFGDQLFWGSIIAQLGVGPSPIPYKELTIGKLADAIGVALKPSTKQKSYQVSQLMNCESGLEKAISSFHDHLPLWRMRCAVCHSRPAVWKVKGSQLILSGFAMTVLVGAGLLKPNDLTLYHVINYDTSRNPQNPLSAASQVLLGSFSKFVTDIGDVCSAMLAEIPCRSNRADDNSGFNVRRDPGPQLSSQDRNIHILKSQNFTSRPIGRLCQQTLNIIIIPPMEITLTISKGFHNATLILHDDTVKSIPKVTCLRSGVKTAAKELISSVHDSFSGLIIHPSRGLQESGVKGLFKGIGKGITGAFCKPMAGLWGLAAYPLAGLHEHLQSALSEGKLSYIKRARVAQGIEELRESTFEERADVIRQWYVLCPSRRDHRHDE